MADAVSGRTAHTSVCAHSSLLMQRPVFLIHTDHRPLRRTADSVHRLQTDQPPQL